VHGSQHMVHAISLTRDYMLPIGPNSRDMYWTEALVLSGNLATQRSKLPGSQKPSSSREGIGERKNWGLEKTQHGREHGQASPDAISSDPTRCGEDAARTSPNIAVHIHDPSRSA
jgi:hypothetical protein